MNVGGQWGVVVTFLVASGCSLQKWDEIKRNSAGAGNGGAEHGGSVAGGSEATGGKSSTNGTSTTGGVSTTSGGASTTANTTSFSGGTRSMGGTSGAGSLSTTGGTAVVGAPYVVSVTPMNGTNGVATNSKIVIKFSEAMDTLSVTGAIAIPPLKSDSYAQVWSEDNTTLTITPTSGLSYSTGASVASTSPLTYTITLNTAAKDIGGTPMGEPYSSSFTTLRRITQTMRPEAVASANSYGLAIGGSLGFCTGNEIMSVGCWDGIGSEGTVYIFLHYSFASLGDLKSGTVFESAVLNAHQTGATTGFYSGGSVVVERFRYQVLDNSIRNAVPNDALGTLCSSFVSQPSLSIYSSIKSDFAAGNQDMLYRLAPSGVAITSDGLDAFFNCGDFSLVVTFTTP
ncbi:MAG: Ig-like domain-containing protein [Polyangiaceae bacterium]